MSPCPICRRFEAQLALAGKLRLPVVVHSRAAEREVLDMQRAGEHDKVNQQLNLLNDLQSTVQNQRESVNSKMAA